MRGSWRGPRARRERGRGARPGSPLASAPPPPPSPGAALGAGQVGADSQPKVAPGPPSRRAGLGEGRHVTRPGLPLCPRAGTARSGRRSDPGSPAPTDAAPSLRSLREPTAGPLPFVLLGKAVGQRLCDVNWWLAFVPPRERRWGPAFLLPREPTPRNRPGSVRNSLGTPDSAPGSRSLSCSLCWKNILRGDCCGKLVTL